MVDKVVFRLDFQIGTTSFSVRFCGEPIVKCKRCRGNVDRTTSERRRSDISFDEVSAGACST